MNAAPSADNLRQGLPGRRLGGGTRSDRIFAGDYAYLTALVTSDNVSVTAAERPTLLFYVPEMLSANAVEFVLRDANDELVYDATFEVGAEGGVVRVDAAVAEMPALTRNENYSWYFSIVPDAADRAHDVAVHGSVRRVDPAKWLHQQAIDVALLDELPSLAPLEKVRVLHQQANMWHDAVLLLDAFHRAEPHNTAIAAEWSQLLESAGLVTVTSTSQASIQLGAN
ncbi:MAG: DUF928 domain-containing protein [Pseudomonadota bacterium]